MCLIIYKPFDVTIPQTIISSAWHNNPDGAGFVSYAYDNDGFKVNKGYMSLKALKRALKTENTLDKELVLHFRFSTSGIISKSMCHPYGVSKVTSRVLAADTSQILFHNGVLPAYDVSDSKSDTAVFVRTILATQKRRIDKERLLESLPGKYVLCDKHGPTIFGDFSEIEGLFVSNLHSCAIPKRNLQSWEIPYDDEDYYDDNGWITYAPTKKD